MNIRTMNNPLVEKIGLVLLSSFLYAITYVAIDLGTQTIQPATLTTMRLFTAGIIFTILIKVSGVKWKVTRRGVIDLFIVGLLNMGLPFLLMANGLKYISSSLASIIVNTIPLFTVVFAHYMLKDEKINLVKILGTITGIAGATLILIRSETGLAGVGQAEGFTGQVYVLCCSLSSALGIIFMRLRMRSYSPVVLAGGQVFASLVILAPFSFLIDGIPDLRLISGVSWLGMLVASVSAPVAAYWLLIYIVNKFNASLGGFSSIVTPLFSVLIGVFFLNEVITLPIVIGTVLLTAGIFTLNYF